MALLACSHGNSAILPQKLNVFSTICPMPPTFPELPHFEEKVSVGTRGKRPELELISLALHAHREELKRLGRLGTLLHGLPQQPTQQRDERLISTK